MSAEVWLGLGLGTGSRAGAGLSWSCGLWLRAWGLWLDRGSGCKGRPQERRMYS